MMTDKELIQWAKDNSSGDYRPSAEIAARYEESLRLLDKIAEVVLSKASEIDHLTDSLTRWAMKYKNKN